MRPRELTRPRSRPAPGAVVARDAPSPAGVTEVAAEPASGPRRRSGVALLPAVVLAVVALVQLGLTIDAVRGRSALGHDEVISHLAASGHLDDWERVTRGAAPAGRWATGAELRRFLEIDGGTSPEEIRSNLADLDYHPPLYFWALSGARWAGVGILWSGPALNVAAVLAAGLVLFSLLVSALGDRLLAALGVAVLLWSPAVVAGAAVARPYPFLMVTVVALIWVTARLFRSPTSVPLLAGLFGVGVLGLLTAHQFALALVGALVALTVHWVGRSVVRITGVVVAVASSFVVAWAAHPAFIDQYSRLHGYTDSLPASSPGERSRRWAAGFVDLVTLQRGERRLVEVVVVVLGLGLLATAVWWFAPFQRAIRQEPVVGASLGIGGVALLGATAAYLLGRAPPHAVGWQYVLIFWPAIVVLAAFAITAAFAVRGSLLRPTLVLLLLASLFAVSAWRSDVASFRVEASERTAVRAASRATLVVADCLMRGTTPGATMWTPRDASILLALPGDAAPPRVPSGADASRPFLFHTSSCAPAVSDEARFLARLGFERGAFVGWIGLVEVYRLARD